MDIIKELNALDNLLCINEENKIGNKNKEEKNEITRIYEQKIINEKIYQRNVKIMKEIMNKSSNINNINKEMYQKIQELYLKTMNYILPESDFPQYEEGVNINSKIIYKKKDLDLINNYLSSLYREKIKYNLIFRASEQGAYGKIFKKKCSEIERTLVVVLTKNDKTFGGFTESLWDDSNSTKKDKKAFCFSFDFNKIYKSKIGMNAIYCKENSGPIFCDMFGINNNFIVDGGFCKIKQLAESKYDNVSTDYELAEKEVFYIKELETFEIQFEEI